MVRGLARALVQEPARGPELAQVPARVPARARVTVQEPATALVTDRWWVREQSEWVRRFHKLPSREPTLPGIP
jgi:hypothetical protein